MLERLRAAAREISSFELKSSLNIILKDLVIFAMAAVTKRKEGRDKSG